MSFRTAIGETQTATPPAMKSDTAFPGLVALLFLAALIMLILFCAGCAEMPLSVSFAVEIPVEIQK